MKHKIKSVIISLTVIVTLLTIICTSVSASSYIYDKDSTTVEAPNAACFEEDWNGITNGTAAFSSPKDLCLGPDGLLYLADTGNNRIVVLKKDGSFVSEIKSFEENGVSSVFSSPSGVYVCDDGTLCVADTDNARLVFLKDNVTVKVIYSPVSELLPETFSFIPEKVAVDIYGQIYVVSRGFNMGILKMDASGKFMTALGAPSVSASPLEILWRRLMTKEQLERSESYVPTEYNNLLLDDDGFLLVTTSAYEFSEYESGDIFPLQRLNSKGEDVLLRQGDPSGDYTNVSASATYAGGSAIVDCCMLESGGYAILDQKRGRVFAYDSNGEGLYVFGNPGELQGRQIVPAAMVYSDKNYYILDQTKGTLSRYCLTEYGDILHNLLAVQKEQNYEQEKLILENLTHSYPNSLIIYERLGNLAYREKNMTEAMQYFKLAENKENYSKVYTFVRREWIENNILYMLLIVGFVIAAIVIYKRFKRRYLAKENANANIQALEYSNYVCFHPSMGFWNLKRERKGNLFAAVVLVVLVCIIKTLSDVGTGFIFNTTGSDYNFLLQIGLLLIIAVWCISLWCVTSLMDGKGTMRDIFIATAYSFMPYIKLNLIAVILSRFMLENEADFLYIFTAGAILWTAALLIMSVKQTNDYTMLKTFAVIIITLVVILLIVFIAMLIFALMQQFYSFIVAIYQEVVLRI